MTRRKFVATTAYSSVGLAALAATSASLPVPEANGERVALGLGSFHRPYFSRPSEKPDVTTWVQVDLGS